MQIPENTLHVVFSEHLVCLYKQEKYLRQLKSDLVWHLLLFAPFCLYRLVEYSLKHHAIGNKLKTTL